MLPFVGIANRVREYSVLFPHPTLGFTIGRSPGGERDFPAVVESVRREVGAHLAVVGAGDLVSKVERQRESA